METESLEDDDGNDVYSDNEAKLIDAVDCHNNDSDSSHDEVVQGLSTLMTLRREITVMCSLRI